MTRKILTAVSALLCLILIIFIFSNSLDNAKESTQKSDTVHTIVNEVAKEVGFKKEISKSFIRQSAHFLEFTALGFMSVLTLLLAIAPSPKGALSKKLAFCALSVPFCALIAFIDESIQNFSDGRVFDFNDIITDTVGAFVGATLIFSVYMIIFAVYHSKAKKRADN